MSPRVLVSARLVDSNDNPSGRRRLRGRLAKLLQRLLLDLPDAFGREPEIGTNRAQRLRGLAESVMAPQDRALAFVELSGKLAHRLHLHPVEHLLELPLGG